MIITPFVFALWFLFLFELDYTFFYKNQYNFDGIQLHNVLIYDNFSMRYFLTCLTVKTTAEVNITIFFLYK